MKCEELESVIIDYLDNTLDIAHRGEVEKHISSCEKCSDTIREYETIFQTISATEMEKPHESLKTNFNYMLRSEVNKLKPNRESALKFSVTRNWSPVFLRIAASIALLIGGAFLGNIIHQKITNRNIVMQSDNPRDEKKNNILIYTLLNDKSPGQRIKTVNSIEDNASPDPKVINAILTVLNNDDNINVRLAAVYTLSKFLDNQPVLDSLVESLGKQTEPLIQIMLMNILTEKMEAKAVEPMKKIIMHKNTMDQVKYAAEKNINVLL